MENLSLTESIIGDMIQQETFDYEDTPEDIKMELIQGVKDSKKIRSACLEVIVATDGRILKIANEAWAKKGTGIYRRFVENEMGYSIPTAKRILNLYEMQQKFPDLKLYSQNGEEKTLFDLGTHKISSIKALPEDIQEKVLTSAPLIDMNTKQVEKLAKKIKETGNYSEELIEEIREKDKKIADSEQKQKQLQQEKEQKEIEIAELKAKIQELEQIKVQPVEKVEPEVVEKIVEVEKVVEKEVIPNSIKEELEMLRNENKVLIKDNKDKASFIEGQNNTIIEQRQKINNLKIDDSIPEDSLPAMKLGSLLSFIDCFLRDTSGFTLLKGQFSEMSNKSKQTLLNSIGRIEDWCILMKQAVNDDKEMLGNNIIIESEND